MAIATGTAPPAGAVALSFSSILGVFMRSQPTLPGVEPLESRLALSLYFVSPTGNDSGPGTDAAPWRTLQRAADAVRAGDTVTVRAGTYSAGFDLRTDGTAASRITFRADPGVTITGRNARTADGINLEDADFVTIEGFLFTNATGGISRAGIRAVNAEHVHILNNRADGMGTWGILTGFCDDLRIENNVMSRSVAEHGIYVSNSGDRPVIRNNVSWGNYANGIHMNGDASLGGDGIISGALVEGNVIYDNGRGGGSGINCDGVQNSVIRNNLLYNNHASGISLYRIDGGGGSTGNTVVNNTILVASDGRWGINIRDGSTGNRLFNNIVYGYHSYRGSLSVSTNSLPGLVSNHNVLMDRFTTDDGASRLTLAQWRSATGQDANSVLSTPTELFVNVAGNDYHLKAGSPAIDRGTSQLAPVVDLEGRARPSGAGWDVGAYEYASSAPTNRPPVAVNDSASVAEDGAVNVAVRANDSDPDGDALTVQSVGQPANGTAAINADGTVRYTPRANFHGADSFSYTISDGRGGTASASVAVTVTPVNDNPVAVNDSATTPAGTPVSVAVLANDSDLDGDALSVTAVTNGANGSAVRNANGTVTYTPNAGFSGADSFTYTVSDGRGGTATGTVSVTVNAQQVTIGLESDAWNPGRQALVVRGTASADDVEFRSVSSGTMVAVRVAGVERARYAKADVSRLVAHGLGGNDRLVVQSGLNVAAYLSGGDGDDTLQGGARADVLLGGAGADRLTGNGDKDLLIGGFGADLLSGGGGSDLLVGGSTAHDGNDDSLRRILGEWTSSRTYTQRVDALRAGTNGLPALNAATLTDDGAADDLTGGNSSDWFVATVGQDILRDRSSSERLN
jgi:hypothetical protein